MAHDVFISYSSEDKPTADAICATLEGQGIRCRIAPRDILAGIDWSAAIIDAIAESHVLVLVYPPARTTRPRSSARWSAR
jgi:TIR domain-containing protein